MTFATYEEELNFRFYEDWITFWLPIYRKQVLNSKMEDNQEALKEIKINILKNKSLEEYKDLIFEKLGISYLETIIQDNEQLKEEQFLRNEKLIYLVLKKKGLLHEQEELYDIGLIGLRKAINTYDSSKGYKESTYFYQCISNQISQYIYLQNMSKRKCPTSIISLDYQYEENDGDTFANLVQDPNVDIEEEIIKNERNKQLMNAINKLKPSYQEIIKKYYGIRTSHKTQEKIGKELGVTKSAIGDKRKRALKQLKKLLEEEKITI